MTGDPATTVVCAGCGYVAPPTDPFPFRCPSAGTDDVDHVMAREVDPTHVSFPEGSDEPNPFVRPCPFPCASGSGRGESFMEYAMRGLQAADSETAPSPHIIIKKSSIEQEACHQLLSGTTTTACIPCPGASRTKIAQVRGQVPPRESNRSSRVNGGVTPESEAASSLEKNFSTIR